MNRFASNQTGVALILVLWVAALLTVIAGSFAYATRTDMAVLGNNVARARAEAAADAGVHLAAFEAFRPITDPQRWKHDGSEHEFRLGEAVITVSVLDESAKIDINFGSPLLLKGLLKSVGVSEPDSEKLVDAIQDWRDADTLSRPAGAEEEAYKLSGLQQKPANAPFQTLEELRLVMGMTPELYRRIEPMITIYSRQPGINLATASREVLLAIPGVAPEQVDAYVSARAATQQANQPPPPFPPGAGFGAVPNMVGLQVRSSARMADAAFSRRAIIRIIPDPRRPFAVLSWAEEGIAVNTRKEVQNDGD